VAAVLKLIVVWQLADHPMVQPGVGLDTTAYADLARRVVSGDLGLGPGLYYLSPLYIYLLASGLWVTDSFTAVRVLQSLVGALAVGGVWTMTRAWAGTRAAWCAAALMTLTGLMTFYEAMILQASVDVALTTAALLALTWALHHGHRAEGAGSRWHVASGIVFGLAALNRPNMALAAAGLVVVLVGVKRFRPAVLLVLGIAAGMAPVVVRNVIVADQWSLGSSHGGLNFYIGNSDTATGFYHVVPGIAPDIAGQSRDARRVAERALGRPVSDTEASNYFFSLSLDWAIAHPGQAVNLFLKKLGWVFHAQHIALPYSYPFYAYDAQTALRFYVVGPWLLIPLGIVGLGVFIRRYPDRADALVWATFVPAYAASVALFFVAERYRLPLLVPLCVGSGIALDALAGTITNRHWRALVLPMIAFVVILGLANWKTTLSDGRWDEGIRLAQRYAILGQDAEANQWVQRLAVTAPRPGLAHYSVGMQYYASNKPGQAIEYLSEALRLDSGRANTEYGLGQALLKADRAAEALPHLQRGFDAGADVPMPGYDLALALRATGDASGAAAMIQGITPSPADDPEVWMSLGRIASSVQASDVAEPFFRQAALLQPSLASARLQYGLNLLVLNRIEDALRELTEAVRLDPRDPDALAHLGYCELLLGRREDALRHAEAALAIDPANDMAFQVRGAK
jgi:tetratricopeptide (TPR) repeat protein